MDDPRPHQTSLGLFIGSTDHSFISGLLAGSLEATRPAGARLVAFNCGNLRSPHGFEAMRNLLFSLVGPQTVDALVVSGTLSHYVTHEELCDFCRSFRPVPLVSLVVRVNGIPSVVSDNLSGMEALLDHLLDDHGYRRLAFVGGPAGQQEAELRKAAFTQKLAARGLKAEPDWIVEGDYSRAAGVRAAERLAATLPLPFEGIVAANDAMALGIHEVLVRLGLQVPRDVFLTGFDDNAETQIHPADLTTVGQSFHREAQSGASLALDLAARRPVAPLTHLPTHLVLRTSCGCPPGAPEASSVPATSTPGRLRRELMERFQADVVSEALIACSEALATAFTLPGILDTLARVLPGLGLKGAWLSLFQDPKNPSGRATLHLAYDQGAQTLVLPSGPSFEAQSLVPGGLPGLDPRHDFLLVEALYSQTQPLGFVVFSTDEAGVRTCGALRSQISGAFHGVNLLQERRETERLLLRSEKMAALGNLVAGVAHEINTPLGIAVSAASYLQDASERFRRAFEAQQVKKSDLEAYLAATLEAGGLIGSNLERAAHLVTSFKLVAADQTSELRRPFPLKEYLAEILVSLRPQWKHRPVEVELSGPDRLTVDSYPGALVQVVTNLVVNALTHAFTRESPGHIRISVEGGEDNVTLLLADDGVGIPAHDLPRIFDPFFTTRRGQGGTGLGLHIVFNLVEQVLGGTIVCRSEVGKGTVFALSFPRKAPLKATGP